MTKRTYKVIVVIQFVAIMMLFLFSFHPTETSTSLVENLVQETIESPIGSMTPEGQYRQVYQDPFVVYLRRAIDIYAKGGGENFGIMESAVEAEVRDGITSGLDSFDDDYYKSKFVVFTINDSLAGGKSIQIIFQDVPDKIFYAWVYDIVGGGYELRGFSSRDDLDEELMAELVESYKDLIFDEEYAI